MIVTEGVQAAGFIGSDFEKSCSELRSAASASRRTSPLAAFLASDDSGWVNGQTIYAAGGYTG